MKNEIKIQYRDIDSLIPYEHNPRKNNHAVETVAAAISEFGFRVPILIRGDGDLVDGHLRLKAAKVAGLQQVPTISVDDLSDDQILAFRLSVNKLSELASWNEELLVIELGKLVDVNFDLAAIGFSSEEIDTLLGKTGGRTDPDDIPPTPEIPTSREGDIWIMGDHLVMCGDSTNAASFAELMGDDLADMVFTDPPYNVDYQGKAGSIKNDKLSPEKFSNLLAGAFSCLYKFLRPGGGIYVAHADAGQIGVTFRQTFLAAGFKLASCLVWLKNQFILGRADYHWQHEPILYGWKPGAAHRFYGGRKKSTICELGPEIVTKVAANKYQLIIGAEVFIITGDNLEVEAALSTIIPCDKPSRNSEHPTMKPVALVVDFIKNSSRRGEIVADAFGGSGTTLIGSEIVGRRSRVMELDPKFCDVIVERWQGYTGQNALLSGSGAAFTDLKAQRSN